MTSSEKNAAKQLEIKLEVDKLVAAGEGQISAYMKAFSKFTAKVRSGCFCVFSFSLRRGFLCGFLSTLTQNPPILLSLPLSLHPPCRRRSE